jgi:transposase
VKRWREAFEAEGDEGLNSAPHYQPPSRLTDKQQQRLIRTLLKGARASGYANDLWTCPRVLEVIQKLFGVTYHVDYVGTLLHKLGWSVQKPEQRARERDEAAIGRWQREEWPRIKKGSRAKS